MIISWISNGINFFKFVKSEFEVYSEDDMNELYWVKVKFFSNSIRKNPPCFNAEMGIRYSPHLVVKGDEEYLGVTFADGDACVYDKEIDAIVVSLYEGVGYHKLVKGAEFLIMEGPHIVGEGIVKDVENDDDVALYARNRWKPPMSN